MSRDWIKEEATSDEYVLSAYNDYSVHTVAKYLLPTGLLIDKSKQYIGTFEQFVFFYGNKDEIYTRKEINFISTVADIVVFKDFYKETKKRIVPCKVVVTRNTLLDPVEFSIGFTKIINKASDGFNICIVFSEEGMIFTCRSYDSTAKDYYISDIIKTRGQLEELCDALMYSPDYEDFIEYYSYVKECIRFKTVLKDFFSRNRNTYRIDYDDRVAEADEYLFKIESSRINTIEMLFEAEEMEKSATEAEQRNESMIMLSNDRENKEKTDAETKALLDDPEAMIKLLKKKRGI